MFCVTRSPPHRMETQLTWHRKRKEACDIPRVPGALAPGEPCRPLWNRKEEIPDSNGPHTVFCFLFSWEQGWGSKVSYLNSRESDNLAFPFILKAKWARLLPPPEKMANVLGIDYRRAKSPGLYWKSLFFPTGLCECKGSHTRHGLPRHKAKTKGTHQ